MGPSLGFVTDVFFVSSRCGNYYGLFYGRAIVLRHRLSFGRRQVEVVFASPLVGVHPVSFARVSEQNQEKRSLGGK